MLRRARSEAAAALTTLRLKVRFFPQIGGEGTNWYKVSTIRDEPGLTQKLSDLCRQKTVLAGLGEQLMN